MRAERDRRAAILNAEGVKQSAILTAEGEKQSQILRAEGSAQARILEAQGQARAIQQVFGAIHRGKPDPEAAGLPVPPGAAPARPRRLQQDVDHPVRADRRPARASAARSAAASRAPTDDGRGRVGRPRRPEDDAFADTVLEDPAQALAEARGQAGQASAEATEHSPSSRSLSAGVPRLDGRRRLPPAGTARGPPSAAAADAARPPVRRPVLPDAAAGAPAAALTHTSADDTRSPSVG